MDGVLNADRDDMWDVAGRRLTEPSSPFRSVVRKANRSFVVSPSFTLRTEVQ